MNKYFFQSLSRYNRVVSEKEGLVKDFMGVK